MFASFATAPGRLKGGIAFGLLLTAIPAAFLVAFIVYAIDQPSQNGGSVVARVLIMVFAALFVLAGVIGLRRLLAGDSRGAHIFGRPAYPLLVVCVFGLVRALLFSPDRSAGGIALALVLIAFVAAVLFYFRWLASSMPERDIFDTGTSTDNSPLVRVVREACVVAADVKLGKIHSHAAALRLVDEAGGSQDVLADATRILSDQVAESTGEVRAISEVAARIASHGRQLAGAGSTPLG